MSEYHSMCEHWIEENAKLEEEIKQLRNKLKKIENAFGDKQMSDEDFINEVGEILESISVGDQE